MNVTSIESDECGRANVCEINPLRDVRWPAFVRDHPASSIFHTTGWLEALRRTYNYQPAALSRCDSRGNLVSALLYCRVNSWLTGHRLVSLPFSDHCELLVRNADDCALLTIELQKHADQANCRYVELRPISTMTNTSGLGCSAGYYLHRLDLRPGVTDLFRTFHRDCVQRKIRRAEREALTIIEGRTSEILEQFYSLAVRTRRRQGLPPQPFVWFQNLTDCLGSAITIRIASKNDQPIAGIVTLEYNKTLMYKYGASDERFHSLGGMAYLFWIAIQDAIYRGLAELDMGRSEIDNPGLVAFKDRWGASRSALTYWRFPATQPQLTSVSPWVPGLLKRACSHIPDRLLISLGARLYRHVG
jgi:hypothetical protein